VKYRLVAIDLDGTVLNKDGAIILGAKDAVQRLLDRGVVVTLATGRMYQPSNRFAAELNITAPLICYQGALIREPGAGDILWHKPLPPALARKVVAEMRQEGVHQYAYVDGSIYVEQTREDDVRYARQNGAELHRVDDLTMALDMPPTELAARGTPEEIDRVLARVRANCGPEVIVNKVHASFCEIAHAGSGKGNALQYLAGRLGIPQSRTVAIGDSPNDVSMLRWAGLGIVVGDAPEEVRAAADWVIDHSAGAGFCEAIARLLEDGGPCTEF
jgi:Cof subfamily protein (haloacid dehalogenase superfamily)